jgi:hypothetical protein
LWYRKEYRVASSLRAALLLCIFHAHVEIDADPAVRALTRHETKKPRFSYEERGFWVLLMLHETNSWLRGQDLNL